MFSRMKICRGFETFIAGHEYAHHLLEHKGVKNIADLDNEKAFDADYYSQELDADSLGADLAFTRMVLDGDDEELSLAGIYLGLKSIDLSERINNIRLYRNEDYYFSETHPAPIVRQEAFLDQAHEHSGGNDEWLQATVSIDYVVEHMWDEFINVHNLFIEKFGEGYWETDEVDMLLQAIKSEVYDRYRASD